MTQNHNPDPTRPALSNAIAIASGKGGVGKTWVAATLSQALSFAGQKVLLIDGDLGLANVDVQLGLQPSCDLADALMGKCALGDAVTPVSGGVKVRGGFDVLAGRSGSGDLGDMNSGEWTRLMTGLGQVGAAYDRLILDLGAGIDHPVLTLAQSAELIAIVLNDEPTSLTDAYALIKKLSQAGRVTNMALIVNMATSTQDGQKTAETISRATRSFLNLDVPLAGIIRRDPKVPEAIRRQQPFLARHPQSLAAADMEGLAQALLRKRSQPAPARQTLPRQTLQGHR